MTDKTISRFLSLILRHDPVSIGLNVDAQGWARVEDIIARADMPLTAQDIARVVVGSDKQRFTLSEDGALIRANQGHSFPVDLGLIARTPPDRLYHGTADRNVPTILRDGLKPMSRQHVHLSPDPDTAHKVGQRHGHPVILTIHAQAAHAAGQVFYLSANGVWLTDPLAPEFIHGPA